MARAVLPLEVSVTPHHLFRYPSEWDPREGLAGQGKRSNTKGGYLEGKLELPPEVLGEEVLVRLTTVPAYSPEDETRVRLEVGEEYLHIHPTVIGVIRKGRGMRRDKSKEPVPNIQHYRQEFLIKRENNQRLLKIKNQTSSKDDGRRPCIPLEDTMYELKEDLFLTLGRNARELNLVILIPKTEARSTEDDISIDKMLELRVPGSRARDKTAREKLKQLYVGKKAANLKRMRLKVEVISMKEDRLIATGVSEEVTDTGSKTVGALDVWDATPLMSCERGGRKVIMVSMFKDWDKSVKPFFCLTDRDGERINDACIVQPKKTTIVKEDGVQSELTTIDNDGKAIIFLTPDQEDLTELTRDGRKLSLLVQREGDGKESLQQFPFTYVKHTGDSCLHCNIELLDGRWVEMPSARVSTGPNMKRRRMSSATAAIALEEPAEADDSVTKEPAEAVESVARDILSEAVMALGNSRRIVIVSDSADTRRRPSVALNEAWGLDMMQQEGSSLNTPEVTQHAFTFPPHVGGLFVNLICLSMSCFHNLLFLMVYPF